MRTREQIEHDGTRPEFLILEVLLDLRELVKPQTRGRPKGSKNKRRVKEKTK